MHRGQNLLFNEPMQALKTEFEFPFSHSVLSAETTFSQSLKASGLWEPRASDWALPDTEAVCSCIPVLAHDNQDAGLHMLLYSHDLRIAARAPQE